MRLESLLQFSEHYGSPYCYKTKRYTYRIVMAITHLHNFPKRSIHFTDVCTPPGTFDQDVDGKLVEGSSRIRARGNRSTLFLITDVLRKYSPYAKDVRDEIAL
jgi:hypothetical protein